MTKQGERGGPVHVSGPIANLLDALSEGSYGRKRVWGECCKCGKKVDPETEFKDETSKKEYAITLWCQACQDAFFEGPTPEDEEAMFAETKDVDDEDVPY